MSEKKDDYWKRKYDSLFHGVVDLEQRLRLCQELNAGLVLEKKQWELDKQKQQTIIAQAVNAANANSQALGLEIQALKEEMRCLKGE